MPLVDLPPAIIQPYHLPKSVVGESKPYVPDTSKRLMFDNSSAPVLEVAVPTNIYINAGNCPIVINSTTGKVDYKCAPDQAARDFWKAVEAVFPAYCHR